MFAVTHVTDESGSVLIQDPPIAQLLFSNTKASIVFGELAVGLGLIVGALVGVAAFFGALMNMSFLMAGTVSTNPVLFFAGILLILAWKNAGYIGVDRYLLAMLGTPWKQMKLGTPAPRTTAARAA